MKSYCLVNLEIHPWGESKNNSSCFTIHNLVELWKLVFVCMEYHQYRSLQTFPNDISAHHIRILGTIFVSTSHLLFCFSSPFSHNHISLVMSYFLGKLRSFLFHIFFQAKSIFLVLSIFIYVLIILNKSKTINI